MEDRQCFVCPSCGADLTPESGRWKCLAEATMFVTVDGIPDFVLPERRVAVEKFLQIYQKVRQIEQWGDGSADYVIGLPFVDGTRKHEDIWNIRSKTYQRFLEDFKHSVQQSARVLDLGAGNCWLSIRLRNLGYLPTAVDVNLDERDGLRAAQFLEVPRIHRVRAEFEHLPFARGSFHVIVLNASLHYVRDPIKVIRSVSSLLTEGGVIYVLDSPVYQREADGDLMVRERSERIARMVEEQVPDDLRGSFLTHDRIQGLTDMFVVTVVRPTYGLLWQMRPLIASLLRRRRPSEFLITKLALRPGHLA